jgi:hypothetical protein
LAIIRIKGNIKGKLKVIKWYILRIRVSFRNLLTLKIVPKIKIENRNKIKKMENNVRLCDIYKLNDYSWSWSKYIELFKYLILKLLFFSNYWILSSI